MNSALKRTKNGEPIDGTLALFQRIEQLRFQADWLSQQVYLLETLRAELPDDLSDEAQAALALLVTTGGGK